MKKSRTLMVDAGTNAGKLAKLEALRALPDEAQDLPVYYSVAPRDEDREVVFDDVHVQDDAVELCSDGHLEDEDHPPTTPEPVDRPSNADDAVEAALRDHVMTYRRILTCLRRIGNEVGHHWTSFDNIVRAVERREAWYMKAKELQAALDQARADLTAERQRFAALERVFRATQVAGDATVESVSTGEKP